VQNRYNKQNGKKGWIKALFLVVAWMLIFSLARGLVQVKKGYLRIEQTKARLEKEEMENSLLKEKLSLVMTDEYRQKLVREQLNMQKIGEVVGVLPKFEAESPRIENKQEEMPNWHKWWSLLK